MSCSSYLALLVIGFRSDEPLSVIVKTIHMSVPFEKWVSSVRPDKFLVENFNKSREVARKRLCLYEPN